MEEEQLAEGEIVLCTVEKIIGTTVFVKIEGNGEGTIVTSEISPGRIRNLRDYVIPGKKIVCKIIRAREGAINLSLRIVKPSEKKELLDKISKEQSYKAILKTVLGKEKAEETQGRIIKENSLSDFFENIKENPKLLEKYIEKQEAEKIIEIIKSKTEKPKEIKQVFKISSKAQNGVIIIKNIIQESVKNTKAEVTYLAAGKYRLVLEGKDFKELKAENNKILESIEKQAKKQN